MEEAKAAHVFGDEDVATYDMRRSRVRAIPSLPKRSSDWTSTMPAKGNYQPMKTSLSELARPLRLKALAKKLRARLLNDPKAAKLAAPGGRGEVLVEAGGELGPLFSLRPKPAG